MAVPLGLYKNYSAMACGQPVEVDVTGKKLVIPVADELHMIGRNQYTLSTANGASPYGGATQFSAPPDNLPGTVRIIGVDDCYLMNTAQSVKSKVLHSGYLDAIDELTFDDEVHTMTSEFTVVNDGEGEDVTVISDCSSTEGWVVSFGDDPTMTSDGNELYASATGFGSAVLIRKSTGLDDIKTSDFLVIKGRVPIGSAYTKMFVRLTDGAGYKLTWHGTARFEYGESEQTYVFPLHAPVGTVGALPTTRDENFNLADLSYIDIGIDVTTGVVTSFYISSVAACNGQWAEVEMAVHDEMASHKWSYFTYTNSAYTSLPTDSYDGYGSDNARLYYLDGGSASQYGLAKKRYQIGTKCETVSAFPTGSATYSSNCGTQKRTGFAILMPPSDNNRTDINKCQLKVVTYYDDENGNRVPDLSGNGNEGTITGNVTKLSRGILTDVDGGTVGRVSLGNAAAFSRDGSFTIFGRVKPLTAHSGAVMGKWLVSGSENSCYLGYISSNGTVSLFLEYGTGYTVLTSDVTIQTGTEVFLAYTYDAVTKEMKVVVDGTVKTGLSTLDGVNVTDVPVEIGGYGAVTPDLEIYEVGYIPACLSDAEIADIRLGCIPDTVTGLWMPTTKNMGASTIELSNDADLATGLQHMANPYLFLYDPTTSLLDYFVFSEHPDYIKYVQDENGDIVRLILHPGNGTVYHAQTTYPDMTLDGDSDTIPNVFSDDAEGSVMKLLKGHDFATDFYKVNALTKSVTTNDFGITADDIGIYPFTSSHGELVFDEDMNLLTPDETVTTETGDVDVYDVTLYDEVRVKQVPGNNAGDVQVYDTITPGATTGWARVTSVGHVFTGDCVVQNGIIRLVCSDDAPNIFVYDGSAWQTQFRWYYINGAIPTSITSDVVVVSDGTDTATIIRGSPCIWISNPLMNIHLPPRFVIHDDDVSDGQFLVYGGGGAQKTTFTLTNEYLIMPDINNGVTYFLVCPLGGTVIHDRYQTNTWSIKPSQSVIGVGALPISPKYVEAEDMTLESAATVIEDVSAYDGYAVQLTGMSSRANEPITLDSGTYTVFSRLKTGAVNDNIKAYFVSSGGSTIMSAPFANPTTDYSIVKCELTLPSEYDNVPIIVKVVNLNNNNAVVDYILILKTSAIETAAKRSLAVVDSEQTTMKISR